MWSLIGLPGIRIHRPRRLDPSDHFGERRLTAAVEQAEIARVFDLGELQATLARNPGRRVAPLLRAVAAPPRWTTRSGLEDHFASLVAGSDLATPAVNVWLPDAQAEVDLADVMRRLTRLVQLRTD